jgi:hypothetical protein
VKIKNSYLKMAYRIWTYNTGEVTDNKSKLMIGCNQIIVPFFSKKNPIFPLRKSLIGSDRPLKEE